MTYILGMIATRDVQFSIGGRPMWPTYWTWYRRVNHNIVLLEDLCDLHTGHVVIPPYE